MMALTEVVDFVLNLVNVPLMRRKGIGVKMIIVNGNVEFVV